MRRTAAGALGAIALGGALQALVATVELRGQDQQDAAEAAQGEGEAETEAGGASEGEGLTPEDLAGQPEMPVESAVDKFFNGATKDNLQEKVEGFYAPNASFEDPFVKLDSRDGILSYYRGIFQNLEEMSFDVKEEFVSGDETVALWTMTLKHNKLAGGEPIVLEGVTHLRFQDGKVVAHRNVFDAGALVYENTPFVGMLVRWVKNRVAAP